MEQIAFLRGIQKGRIGLVHLLLGWVMIAFIKTGISQLPP